MPDYLLSPESLRDLEFIEEYTIQNWSASRAKSYIQQFFAAFQKIADNPNIGRTRDDIPAPYKVFAVGSHLVVYRYAEKQNRIEVLNILHPAMNLEERLHQALTKLHKN